MCRSSIFRHKNGNGSSEMDISKADWKLYRERVPDWQEHYMEKLTEEYVKLLTSPGHASDHFWEYKSGY